ncbi:AAA family ATPase [Rhodococcus pyridinivorans]|uniref:AAA family ATPase n=1 Tax=Rhodococcus pyridinivorans TaxID=103816 RepID=UPI0020000FB3|nr:AAA family ATPase [Rhodococcus pyridinivorans]UPK66297.1 AAA family ATPase [Rhodococcus pyridinivorans]
MFDDDDDYLDSIDGLDLDRAEAAPFEWLSDHADPDHPDLEWDTIAALYRRHGVYGMSLDALEVLARPDFGDRGDLSVYLGTDHPVHEARTELRSRAAQLEAGRTERPATDGAVEDAAEKADRHAEAVRTFTFENVPGDNVLWAAIRRNRGIPIEHWSAEAVATVAAAYSALDDGERAALPAETALPAAWGEMRRRLTERFGAVGTERIMDAHTAKARRVRKRDEATEFEWRVGKLADDLTARQAAQERVRAARLGDAPPMDIARLGEVLERPGEPPYRVAGLIPSDGGTLITAQRKVGKTTFVLNLVRSLLTGERFLDQFDVQPVTGRIAFLNFEVSAAQIGRWAAEAGIDHDRLVFVNLRGRRNPLVVPEDRAALAERLRAEEVESVIVDPFGRAFTGQSQNDAGEVTAFLLDLDEFVRAEVGARDLFLTNHAGWNGDRSRGSTALEDWGDSLILLKADAKSGERYLSALGRDVEVEETVLHFDGETRHLSLNLAEGSRRKNEERRRTGELVDPIVEIVAAQPGINTSGIKATLRARSDVSFQDQYLSRAVEAAESLGLIRRESGGPGKSTRHYPAGLSGVPAAGEGASETPTETPAEGVGKTPG